MLNTLALERKLLTLSVIGALVFALIGIVWGIMSSSQMIFFDGVYSFISVILSMFSLLMAQFMTKSDTRRFPYGKEVLEPISIIVKYTAILILCIIAVISAIQAILSGGREISLGFALLYSFMSTIGCWIVFVILNKRKMVSGFITAEANQWKMDTLLSAAVLLGFLIASLISRTSYSAFIPYVDPLMVLIVMGYFLKVPIVEMIKAFREVLDMAPAQFIQKNVKEATDNIQNHYQIEESILRISKAGNMLYIEIDFVLNKESKIKTVADQDKIREEISEQTKSLKYKKWLTVSFTHNKKWAGKIIV
ncbi:cation transporter [Salipaludibacillus agaradhaerens]|uniref:cation diffusion facilitator family transporter n=1 Tax=Salipaludibacillus agaradhaerens TaxID=76935 RepID=UPI002151BA68|nr:cation transporter [Salipaludibacillus agaradhaerens]MCR6108477.1 cation transporter [Salipaludibacillus agaradhaerens]MCR6120498.1 cation transporter [Salipaludibacillus agaradhaerens]